MQLVDVYSSPYASDILFQLLAERPRANWISHKEMPTREDHETFVVSKPFRYWYLLEIEDVVVGALEATELNEIGVAIFQRYQRLGYARQALGVFLSTHEPLPGIAAKRNYRWLANIGYENHGSQKFFRVCGFVPLQVTYVIK